MEEKLTCQRVRAGCVRVVRYKETYDKDTRDEDLIYKALDREN